MFASAPSYSIVSLEQSSGAYVRPEAAAREGGYSVFVGLLDVAGYSARTEADEARTTALSNT
jgi:hypothetical protein